MAAWETVSGFLNESEQFRSGPVENQLEYLIKKGPESNIG